MADKKISELTELTTPDGTEELVVNDSGTSKKITQTNLLSTALPLAGGTMTGDVSLGDNVKAKFGAGNDLQIYHDGTKSIISDNGQGNLYVYSDQFIINNYPDTQNMARFVSGGAATLYHAGSAKLATTATGVDVTGSVTCDGFTSTGIDDNATSTAITINASEQVGIGTSSPNKELHVYQGGAASTYVKVENPSGFAYYGVSNDGSPVWYGPSAKDNIIYTNGTEKARFLTGGGLAFNGDNTQANALDDYEEGTWTPVLTASGTDPATFRTQTGKYTKVGRSVTVSADFGIGATDGGTGNYLLLSGLPFTSFGTGSTGFAEQSISGAGGFAAMETNWTKMIITNYNYTYPGGANARWILSLTYQAA